ncbi:MAG: M48 family metalloprotease [Bdellovibrionaceae bacterium]|nr:M48 family metalloprotease [Pseudobdellovibrionaceae bacterium]
MHSRLGLILGFFVSLFFNVLIFIYGDFKLYNFFKSIELKGQDPYGALRMRDDLCEKLKMEKPKIRIYESQSINSFTLGLFWNSSTIFVSRGSIQHLNSTELEQVILLGLCQIKKMDSFAFGVVSVLANTLAGFAYLLDQIIFLKFIFKSELMFFSWLIKPVIWVLVKSVASFESFYRNDRLCCDVLKDKRQFCELLWKLDGYAKTIPDTIPEGTAHLFLVHPSIQLQSFFERIHPSVQRRIVHLIGHSPL